MGRQPLRVDIMALYNSMVFSEAPVGHSYTSPVILYNGWTFFIFSMERN